MNDLTQKAKKIIEDIIYITIATVSKDGEPWNSPVYSAYDEDYNFYWASWIDNQHSKNIKANGKTFLVIYDSTVPEGAGQGVYVKAVVEELNKINEIEHALKYLYGRKNKEPRTSEQFMGDYPRRVYKAIPQGIWLNDSGDLKGNFIDVRKGVKLQ